jgi:hypothetical protein
MLYPIQYEFLFLFTTLADPELELGAGAKTLIFRLQLRLLAAPAPQHCLRLCSTIQIGADVVKKKI